MISAFTHDVQIGKLLGCWVGGVLGKACLVSETIKVKDDDTDLLNSNV